MKVGGLVLAGGRSRRFGSEKATALLNGRPLIAHVVAALDLGCAEVAVNAPRACAAAAWAHSLELTLLSDPLHAPDGPLTGVREGLRWAARQGFGLLATAPCDTPRLPHDLAAQLVAALAFAPRAQAAHAVTTDGMHPLCAVWRIAAAEPVLDRALGSGAHPPVRAVLAELEAVAVAFDDPAAFANLNTPEDLSLRKG